MYHAGRIEPARAVGAALAAAPSAGEARKRKRWLKPTLT